MKTVKEKLYNYEQRPPDEIWVNVRDRISGAKTIEFKPHRKQIRIIALSSAAAAIIALVIISTVFKTNPIENPLNPAQTTKSLSPRQKEIMVKNYQALESIIKAPENKKLVTSMEVSHSEDLKYITISGPEGEPVKISPKVATLIISADGENPPKPVWNQKINKWQHIMLTNNITPTSGNLIDIIQKASNTIE
ncbi:MAG: hypothetical protein J0H55_03355 [Chitinophagaceae bacterium]|nr:hypothetical protein [Chitinophagaceae bacterium]